MLTTEYIFCDMKYYVYILESVPKKIYYIGQTNNPVKRVLEHNTGRSKYTKSGMPWKLVHSQECKTRSEVVKLEKKLKAYKKRSYIEKFINKK